MGHHADSPKSSVISLSLFCLLITRLLSSCPLSPHTLSQAVVLVSAQPWLQAPPPWETVLHSHTQNLTMEPVVLFFLISLATSNRVTLVLCLGKANSGCPSLGVTFQDTHSGCRAGGLEAVVLKSQGPENENHENQVWSFMWSLDQGAGLTWEGTQSQQEPGQACGTGHMHRDTGGTQAHLPRRSPETWKYRFPF